MAEFVQTRIEEMMPEFEQMEKLKLFEKHEIEAIAKQRQIHEYKIQKRGKSKDDYLTYIQYEMDLLKLIRLKRERMGVSAKRNDFEVIIANRIVKIFLQVLPIFKEDVRLWLSFIKFCKQERMYGRVSHMLERMLRAHSDKPDMFKLAANWEFEEGRNTEKARQLLQKGLRMHPENEMLYKQAFRLELLNAATLRKITQISLTTPTEKEPTTQASPAIPNMSPSKNPPLQGSEQQTEQENQLPEQEIQSEEQQSEAAHKKQRSGEQQQQNGEPSREEDMQQDETQREEHASHENDQEIIQQEERQQEDKPEAQQQQQQQKQQTTKKFDKIAEGRLAEVIYESATKKIRTPEFIMTLLSIATKFEFTGPLQERIVNDLLTMFPHDELTWDIMARRELHGLTYANHESLESPVSELIAGTSQISRGTTTMSTNGKPYQPTRDQIKLCCMIYDIAVKQRQSERMWSMYLEALLELNQDASTLPRYKRNLLLGALQEAHSASCLPEKFYLQWVEMLQNMNKVKKIASVLRTATERLNSAELYALRLRFYLTQGDDKQGQQVFQQATTKLGDCTQALVIWKIMLQYYQLKNHARMEQVFQQGLARGADISNALKPMYLEWIVLSKGIVAARKAYDVVSMQHPFSLELHTKMVELEALQPVQNVKQTRKCFEVACDQFGKHNADVWIEYVKFEMQKGNAMNMTSIYRLATKTLEPALSDIFINAYNLLKTSMT